MSDQDYFYVCTGAPQAAVLNHTNVKAHVTHGGANSLAESYAAGVPVVVLPHFVDQPHNAARARDLGAGFALSTDRLKPEVCARPPADLRARSSCRLGHGHARTSP